MGSPKQGSALRHGGHAHSAHHLPAAVTNARAALFAAGLLIVTLISILGFNLSSMDPREPTSRAACGGNHVGPGTESPYHDKRSEVYDKMEAEFYDKGAEFLFGSSSTTSQSLKLSDIFELRNGEVHPVLKPARPPVRANVLRMDPEFAASIQEIVKDNILHHFRGGVWLQDPDVYHMSIFHASHHLSPVPATAKQLADEVRAVKGVSKRLCPLRVSLDRVILTATGVLLACWQVVEGTDPAELRDELKEALPRAPKQQLYNRVMLHTSLARILAPPTWPDGTLAHNAESAMPIFRSIVSELNQKLCRKQHTVTPVFTQIIPSRRHIAPLPLSLMHINLIITSTTALSYTPLPVAVSCHAMQTVVRELWNVEEMDVLALALQGKMSVKRFNLTCIQPDWVGTI
ncbi:unnamed protein product [Closterium sp. NIES-65]|nr:unnamed protein product [Closterium sp. NIES-65]